jgi:hypothetical protein
MSVADCQVLVGLRDHRQRTVAKDLLQQDWIAAPAQVVGGEGVAQQMRVDAPSRNTGYSKACKEGPSPDFVFKSGGLERAMGIEPT